VSRAAKIEEVREVLRIADALDDESVADNLLYTLVTRVDESKAMLLAALAVISDDALDMLVGLAKHERKSMYEYLGEHATDEERVAAAVVVAGAA
jgi:hypothetical protein